MEAWNKGYNQALKDLEDKYVECMSSKDNVGCPGCDNYDSCIIPLVELLREDENPIQQRRRSGHP